MSLQLLSNFRHRPVQAHHIEAAFSKTSDFEYADAGKAAVLDRLAKALVEAGVDAAKLDRHAEGEKNLTMVARLFGLSVPADAEPDRNPRKAPSPLPKWRLKRVNEHIDVHISEQITLPELAAAARMSRMYFACQFRVATGMKPHDYVLKKRIERAQHLLLTTSEPLVEIALGVGFQTQAHFTTIFKKIVGITPLRWRRKQQVRATLVNS